MAARRLKDISGLRFGTLVVLRYAGRACGNQLYDAVCDCGKIGTFYYANLVTGRSASCGCLIADKLRHQHTTHGESYQALNTKEYKAWQDMKARCSNSNRHDYRHYGGRGISVCDKWANSFEAFLADMGRKPSAAHSLDRINNDGNYEPENCRWATRTEQNNNTRRNVRAAHGHY